MKKIIFLIMMVAGVMFVTTSCNSVKYPKCESDKDCKNKNKENPNEVCYNKTCVECNSDSDCKNDYLCKKHQCVPECRTDADCESPKICKNEKCEYECTKKEDCDEGYDCKEYRCEVELECTTDVECDAPKTCIDNKCDMKQKMITDNNVIDCSLEKVNFDFNEYILTSDAREILERDAECIKTKNTTIIVEGHCDERGTEEYNLNLGQKRAYAVKKYLDRLGVNVQVRAVSKGEEEPISSGSNENAWSENRRAEINFE